MIDVIELVPYQDECLQAAKERLKKSKSGNPNNYVNIDRVPQRFKDDLKPGLTEDAIKRELAWFPTFMGNLGETAYGLLIDRKPDFSIHIGGGDGGRDFGEVDVKTIWQGYQDMPEQKPKQLVKASFYVCMILSRDMMQAKYAGYISVEEFFNRSWVTNYQKQYSKAHPDVAIRPSDRRVVTIDRLNPDLYKPLRGKEAL